MQLEMAIALLLENVVQDMYASRQSSALQPLQWSILRYLAHATSGPKDLKSIAGYLGATESSVGRAVNALERTGLVNRGRDPQLGRSAHVEITDDGKAALPDDPLQKVAWKIGTLADNEREALAKALRKLLLMEHKLGCLAPLVLATDPGFL